MTMQAERVELSGIPSLRGLLLQELNAQVRSVAPGEPIPGLPEMVWRLAAALETFDPPVPMAKVSRRFGVELTRVADFARSRVER